VTITTRTDDRTAVYGLVLAGGRSRRMGRDKAALAIGGGESQLARSVALLRRHITKVFVSVRADQRDDPARAGFDLIEDRYDGKGPAAGILSALETFPDVSWLVLACDLPRVDDETIAVLLDNADPGFAATAYRSVNDGLPEPLCAVWHPRAAALLREQFEQDRLCPRKALIGWSVPLLAQPTPGALDNVNTPEDLARVAGS